MAVTTGGVGNVPHGAPAAWNQAAALEAVEGDSGLLVEMAELFLEDSAGLTAAIAQAIAHGRASDLHHAAHTLKGSVANFCAERAREAAYHLEVMGRTNDLRRAQEGFAVLVEEMHRVETELQQFVQQNSSPQEQAEAEASHNENSVGR